MDTLKLKLARLEREKKELEDANEKLQQKVHNLLTVDGSIFNEDSVLFPFCHQMYLILAN